MITCTTMVLLILVEVTRPILVLRLPAFFAVAVSAIYFFLFLAVAAVFFFAGLAVLLLVAVFALAFFLLALLPAAAFFAFEAVSPAASAAGWPLLATTIPSSFSRITVWTRATSLRRPRILFRLSVCPILSWNFRRKSWSLSSCCWCSSSASVRLLSFSTSMSFLSRAPQRLRFPTAVANGQLLLFSSAHLPALQISSAIPACWKPDASLPVRPCGSLLPSQTGSCPDEQQPPSGPARPCPCPYGFQPASWSRACPETGGSRSCRHASQNASSPRGWLQSGGR